MYLNVSPESLPGIGAQLHTIQAALSTVVHTELARAVPIPAGADAVGMFAAISLIGQTAKNFATTVPGLAHLSSGAEMIYPVSAAYGGGDAVGGAKIGVSGARFSA